MKRIGKMKECILGCSLIVFSGLIFTFERFLAIFLWLGKSVPGKFKGSGSWPSEPSMPTILDNLFVPLLLIIGFVIIIMSFLNYKDSDNNIN